MANKKLIRLTEADLHRIVKESVNNVLNEGMWDNIKSGWRGAKAGYNYSKGVQDNQNNYNDMMQRGVNPHVAADSYNKNDAVSNVLSYIRKMNITVDEIFVERLTRGLNRLAQQTEWFGGSRNTNSN